LWDVVGWIVEESGGVYLVVYIVGVLGEEKVVGGAFLVFIASP
jgi:hypothetical protein